MRQDLISSAVTFLKDPSVADATMDKKLEFLQSKGMTQPEIDEALRVASSTGPVEHPLVSSPQAPASAAPVPAYPYAFNAPPIPERDWKDYFVMATVSVGVAYGIYEVARRYVLPMIMPPTPASLEADKAALEAEFARTEALVEQLASDTKELKESERKRSETFDQVIKDARNAVQAVQAQADERKQDLRLLKSHVETLQNLIPKSLEHHKETQEAALKDLQTELKSLKQLVTNRTRAGGVPPISAVPTSVPTSVKEFMPKIQSEGPPEPSGQTLGQPAAQTVQPVGQPTPLSSTPSPVAAPSEPQAPSIPAWQRAAAK